MQTVTLIVVGLIVLAAFYLAGRFLGEGGRRGAAQALRIFLLVWLVAALANLAIGYYVAAHALWIETALFFLIFGIPAACAVLLLRNTQDKQPKDVA